MAWLQVVLLVIALVAVPWMLLPKPLILRKQHIQVRAAFLMSMILRAGVLDVRSGYLRECWSHERCMRFS